MPRCARKKSESGIYHIMMRGINRQVVFVEDEDREKFIETISCYKIISQFELYGYCLMDNHVHLLVKEVVEPVSMIIKRISSSFVYWYNRKYERCGHLFQERFKSEAVDSEAYFLTVLRYIHQNPLKAGLSQNIEKYKWSSANDYIKTPVIVDTGYALGMFSEERTQAVRLLKEYMNEHNEDRCLENDEKYRMTDPEVRMHFAGCGVADTDELKQLGKNRREEIIRAVKALNGVTIRQLSRITGISKSVIDRI